MAKSVERFCLVQSESSDWFFIPVSKLGEWEKDELDIADEYPDWVHYVELHNLSFADPKSK